MRCNSSVLLSVIVCFKIHNLRNWLKYLVMLECISSYRFRPPLLGMEVFNRWSERGLPSFRLIRMSINIIRMSIEVNLVALRLNLSKRPPFFHQRNRTMKTWRRKALMPNLLIKFRILNNYGHLRLNNRAIISNALRRTVEERFLTLDSLLLLWNYNYIWWSDRSRRLVGNMEVLPCHWSHMSRSLEKCVWLSHGGSRKVNHSRVLSQHGWWWVLLLVFDLLLSSLMLNWPSMNYLLSWIEFYVLDSP